MVLRELGLEDEAQATAAHTELAADGFSFLPFVEPNEPWAEDLSRSGRLSRGEGLVDDLVPATDLYGVVQGAVVGQASVRHRLTAALGRSDGEASLLAAHAPGRLNENAVHKTLRVLRRCG